MFGFLLDFFADERRFDGRHEENRVPELFGQFVFIVSGSIENSERVVLTRVDLMNDRTGEICSLTFRRRKRKENV